MITSSESEEILTEGFTLVKELLPSYAWYGRGSLGPKLFMTDDCSPEINSLSTVWPASALLLCIFHVLQALWRWLWSSQHGVTLSERPHCLKLFRDLLYSETEEEFIQKRQTLEEDPIINKNYTYKTHLINCYFTRIDKWAIFVRREEEMATHNMNTNNMTETTFKIFKEFLLHRHKCYNLGKGSFLNKHCKVLVSCSDRSAFISCH